MTNNKDLLPLQVLLLGIITVAALYWQWKLIEKDIERESLSRLKYPALFSLVVAIGIIVFSLLSLFDPQKQQVTWWLFISVTFRALCAALIIIVKAYFGPIVTAISACTLIYFYAEYRDFHSLPLVQNILDWLFSPNATPLQNCYLLVSCLVACAASIHGSFITEESSSL